MPKISQYTQVQSVNSNDKILLNQTVGAETNTYSASIEQVGDNIAGTQQHADLETDDQTLIGGVNEVNDKADTNATNIGDLSQLTTTDKSSLVGAVNEVNGRTKPTTVTPTFNSSQSNYSIPFNNTRVYKIGNIVYFTSTIQADNPYGSSPGQDVYSGLPKPYSNDNIYMGFCAWNVTSNNMRVIVTSDGKLLCRGGNTGTAYDVSFSYVCQ